MTKNSAKMKVVLTVDCLSSEHGGPSQSVPAIAKGLKQAGADVELWTLRSGWAAVTGITVRGFESSRELAASLKALDPKSTVLHDNGLWLPFNTIVCSAAKKARIPYAISPRGMLDRLSLKQSYWKKRIAWFVYQYRLLAGATFLHATSDREAQGICNAGFSDKVVMLPNGVEVPPLTLEQPKRGDTTLYLSRLHPQKGIEVMLKAWAAIGADQWRLKIAGNGEASYVDSLKGLAEKLGISNQVEWLGPLDGDRKWSAFGEADFFVLPSFSESFGIVIAEALASGLPVVTTTGTPWLELKERGCGVAVEPNEVEIASALREFMQYSVNRRAEMGRRGRELMIEKYSWPRIANEMLDFYSKALAKANS